MGKFSFSSSPLLSETQIVQTGVQTRFTDIANKVNTTKFDIESFRKQAVRYRHLDTPGTIFLRDQRIGAAIFAGVLNKVGVINWTNCRILHTAGINSAQSGDRANSPPYSVYAEYISTRWEESNYEILIGYTTDGGATWAEFPYTARWLGRNHANTQVLWTAPTTDPISGAANYWPPSMYQKRITRTQVAVMDMSAVHAGVSPMNIDGFAIGIRVNGPGSPATGTYDVHPLDRAKIYLSGRENTF